LRQANASLPRRSQDEGQANGLNHFFVPGNNRPRANARERLVAMTVLQNSNNVICFLKGSAEIERF
jgi:hypothetical protein